MTDYSINNPMLDDDEDEAPVAAHTRPSLNLPVRPVVASPVPVSPPTPTTVNADEVLDQVAPPTRKGVPNSKTPTSRARVTEGNATYLAFGAMFPGADAQAFSMLALTNPSPVSKGGELPSVYGTEKRLRKLRDLGMVERFRLKGSPTVHWGVTDRGIAAAREFGYLQSDNAPAPGGIRGISHERLNHYRLTAHVAAQFASPHAFFKRPTPTAQGEVQLGLGPVELEDLISEAHVRREQKPVADRLIAASKEGTAANDFGLWRERALQAAVREVEAGDLAWKDLTLCYPQLLTMGQPQSADEKQQVKSTHWPDLVINRDGTRSGKDGRSLAIEVELSVKSGDEYEQILRTYAKEFAQPLVYEQVIYFTVNNQVDTLLRKVDKRFGFNLFDSGRLKVLRLTDRNGELITLKKRVTIA